jgi:hypothetical protein
LRAVGGMILEQKVMIIFVLSQMEDATTILGSDKTQIALSASIVEIKLLPFSIVLA